MANPPIYFAYVDPDQTTFDPTTMLRMDETIFSLEIKHDEGQICMAEVTIKNPYVGLLSATRKQWCWIAYEDKTGHVTPVFFGALVGIPTGFFAELIKLTFHARPQDYIQSKQACAETLKTYENYDPIWLGEQERDNPDKILEGWSALYHVDRLTHAVTASDVLEGEDGTITFTEDQVLYDGMEMTMGETPLYAVQIQATVDFTQRCIGYIAGPPVNIQSYTGGSFKDDFPKPGASFGGGWFCESSFVVDVFDTDHARTFSQDFKNKNPDVLAGDCEWATQTGNVTSTRWPGIVVKGTEKTDGEIGMCSEPLYQWDQRQNGGHGAWEYIGQSLTETNLGAGVVDPGAYAEFNMPGPHQINTAAKATVHYTVALSWTLNCTWTFRYEAKREYTELCIINIVADLQQTVVSPTIEESTKVIKLKGANVGQPLMTPEAWTDYANRNVPIATVVYGNDPTVIGGNSYQICVQSGTAGATQPAFSDIPGIETTDNTVIWASTGDSPPGEPTVWTEATNIGLGEIRYVEPKTFNAASGQMEKNGDSYFLLCVGAGETNSQALEFDYVPTLTSSDEGPPLPVPFSTILGPGDQATIPVYTDLDTQQQPEFYTPSYDQPNVQGDQPGPFGAPIDQTIGDTINDGSVTWLQLGPDPPFMPIPLGGTMTEMTARFFFPSDRGAQSILHLINRGRAMIRYRARCVKVVFDAPIEYCLNLSCRKNATLYDSRIPGGVATGKVISYTLTWSEQGEMIGHVEIGVCVGNGNSVSAITGTPEYTAATGYCLPGYQLYDGGTYVLAEEDISYTFPAPVPYDDGMALPLQQFPGTVTILMPDQNAALNEASAIAEAESVGDFQFGNYPTAGEGGVGQAGSAWYNWIYGGAGTYALECDPKACEVVLPTMQGGPFNGSFFIETSTLGLPNGCNLSYSGPSP